MCRTSVVYSSCVHVRPRRRRVLGIACCASRAHARAHTRSSRSPAACLRESRGASAARKHNHDTPRKTLLRALARLTQTVNTSTGRAESSHVGCWGVRRASKAKRAHHAHAIALRGEEAATGRADRLRAEACRHRAGRRHHRGGRLLWGCARPALHHLDGRLALVGRARSPRSMSASDVARAAHARASTPAQQQARSTGDVSSGGEETTGRL